VGILENSHIARSITFVPQKPGLGFFDSLAISPLFSDHRKCFDMIFIYYLSNAADRGDEAANLIGDIVVKMT